jgi:hypothetical protein
MSPCETPLFWSTTVYAEIPEVGLKFRVSPIYAVVAMAIMPFFGLPYAIIGGVFGLGLLTLCAALGLPKAVDLMFGLILMMLIFAVQFLASSFLAIEAGGSQVLVVTATALLWFTQLACIAIDLKVFSRSIITRIETDIPAGRRTPRTATPMARTVGSNAAANILRR